MKQFVTVTLFLLSIYLPAQQLAFKGSLVDTVRITSNISGYHFDKKGTTTGNTDTYLIVFDAKRNKYILNPYSKTKYRITFEPLKTNKRTNTVKKGCEVKAALISELLKEFEVDYVKPTIANTGISTTEFLASISSKRIVSVAERHHAAWHFKKAYSNKEDNETFFKGMQNIDSINLYLSTAFDTSSFYTVVTDFDDHFDIRISTATACYHFEGKYPHVYRQPWYIHSGAFSPFRQSILNLSINRALVALLPRGFSRIETLKADALIEVYIEWYLRRHNIIY